MRSRPFLPTWSDDDDERALVLSGLFELRITHLEHDDRCAAIDALARKPGGDPAAMFYAAGPRARWHPEQMTGHG